MSIGRARKRLRQRLRRQHPLPPAHAPQPPPEQVEKLLIDRERLEADLATFRRVMDPEEVRDAQDHVAVIDRTLRKFGLESLKQRPMPSNPSKPPRPGPATASPGTNSPSPTPRNKVSSPKVSSAKPAPQGRVLVDRGRRIYHATDKCSKSKQSTVLCDSVAAHFSPLQPCPTCAAGIARTLEDAYGVVSRAERERRGLPLFTPYAKRRKFKGASTKGRKGAATSAALKKTDLYGSPDTGEDVRFTHYSRLEMGMAAYRQNSDEFLAEPTDDDHDWRGGTSMLE